MRYQPNGAESSALVKKSLLAAATIVAGSVLTAPARAAGTAAGTTISNVATATYDLPGGGSGSVDGSRGGGRSNGGFSSRCWSNSEAAWDSRFS